MFSSYNPREGGRVPSPPLPDKPGPRPGNNVPPRIVPAPKRTPKEVGEDLASRIDELDNRVRRIDYDEGNDGERP